MEMRNKNVNAARNIFDRAVILLPRVDSFWLRYSYMEDILGNYDKARQIFERWMEWEPEKHGWAAFIKFELRCGETDRARTLYQRFAHAHPAVSTWLKWAAFEEKYSPADKRAAATRQVYEQAIQLLGEDANDEKLFIAFARFEERCKEVRELCYTIPKPVSSREHELSTNMP